MTTIDLDALRAQRARERAAAGVPPKKLAFSGQQFDLPDELPVAFGAGLRENNERIAVDALLGAGQATAFWALEPTNDDIVAFVDAVIVTYAAPLATPPTPAKRTTSNGASGRGKKKTAD